MSSTPAFANRQGWTDVEPFEIVRWVSDKTIEVRAMNSERDPSWKPEVIPGGFAGHCVNNREQRWIITPKPGSYVFRIRLHKRGGWTDPHGERYKLSDKPIKFHDYNF